MSGFDPEWLALREPADAAARSSTLTVKLAEAFPVERPLRVLDLGAGTGSNARFLSPRFLSKQQWTLVDHDAALLARASESRGVDRSICRIDIVETDLSQFDNVGGLFAMRDLVTASALLDLVSDEWLRRLADHCHEAGAAVLFALSYDGRIECWPADSEDQTIRALVNRHQRTDKGFGAALGPDATAIAAAYFKRLGYNVSVDSSDWRLTAADGVLQQQLIDGWASAATELVPLDKALIDDWKHRRLERIASGQSLLVVGHQDLLGLPPAHPSAVKSPG
ncbi:MAG TPA: class I SAM-dependent methyltransferase [Vicinamibacterales bacterium]|jgi:trans-aconitate methyltransferase